MTKPPAEPRSDREAEWYRRRRVEKDGLPLPAEFRLIDDRDSFTIRFPVSLWPGAMPRHPMLAVYIGGNACIGAFAMLHYVFDALTWGWMVGVALALVGIPLTAALVLRRRISVLPEGIEVAWWPFSFATRRLVHRGIRQTFVVRHGAGPVSYNPGILVPDIKVDLLAGSPDRMSGETLDVWILRADGTRELLVASLRAAEHALFIERWIERRLGIEDASVDGEAFGGGEPTGRARESVGGAEGS